MVKGLDGIQQEVLTSVFLVSLVGKHGNDSISGDHRSEDSLFVSSVTAVMNSVSSPVFCGGMTECTSLPLTDSIRMNRRIQMQE